VEVTALLVEPVLKVFEAGVVRRSCDVAGVSASVERLALPVRDSAVLESNNVTDIE